jgi:hypothetical protein
MIVIFPKGIYGYHNQSTLRAVTDEKYRIEALFVSILTRSPSRHTRTHNVFYHDFNAPSTRANPRKFNDTLLRHSLIRYVSVVALALVCALSLCGLKVFEADITPEPQDLTSPKLVTATPIPSNPADMRDELFPADVQTVIDDDMRQIIKT